MQKKTLSTFEREMKDPKFKEEFEKSYKKFLKLELKFGQTKRKSSPPQKINK